MGQHSWRVVFDGIFLLRLNSSCSCTTDLNSHYNSPAPTSVRTHWEVFTVIPAAWDFFVEGTLLEEKCWKIILNISKKKLLPRVERREHSLIPQLLYIGEICLITTYYTWWDLYSSYWNKARVNLNSGDSHLKTLAGGGYRQIPCREKPLSHPMPQHNPATVWGLPGNARRKMMGEIRAGGRLRDMKRLLNFSCHQRVPVCELGSFEESDL